MICKQLKKKISLFLCAVMLFTAIPINTLAAAEGSFVLTVSLKNQTVIEPTIVNYQQGQTIREALMSSEFTFEGIEDSIITAVNGISGSYSIFCSDGEYDIDRAADLVTTVEFTELTQDEIVFAGRAELLSAMEEYLSMNDEVHSYAPAAKAYDDALKGLRKANAQPSLLLEALEREIENYNKVISGNDITVYIREM